MQNLESPSAEEILEQASLVSRPLHRALHEDAKTLRKLKAELRGLPQSQIEFFGYECGGSHSCGGGVGMAALYRITRLWRQIVLEANKGI